MSEEDVTAVFIDARTGEPHCLVSNPCPRHAIQMNEAGLTKEEVLEQTRKYGPGAVHARIRNQQQFLQSRDYLGDHTDPLHSIFGPLEADNYLGSSLSRLLKDVFGPPPSIIKTGNPERMTAKQKNTLLGDLERLTDCPQGTFGYDPELATLDETKFEKLAGRIFPIFDGTVWVVPFAHTREGDPRTWEVVVIKTRLDRVAKRGEILTAVPYDILVENGEMNTRDIVHATVHPKPTDDEPAMWDPKYNPLLFPDYEAAASNEAELKGQQDEPDSQGRVTGQAHLDDVTGEQPPGAAE